MTLLAEIKRSRRRRRRLTWLTAVGIVAVGAGIGVAVSLKYDGSGSLLDRDERFAQAGKNAQTLQPNMTQAQAVDGSVHIVGDGTTLTSDNGLIIFSGGLRGHWVPCDEQGKIGGTQHIAFDGTPYNSCEDTFLGQRILSPGDWMQRTLAVTNDSKQFDGIGCAGTVTVYMDMDHYLHPNLEDFGAWRVNFDDGEKQLGIDPWQDSIPGGADLAEHVEALWNIKGENKCLAPWATDPLLIDKLAWSKTPTLQEHSVDFQNQTKRQCVHVPVEDPTQNNPDECPGEWPGAAKNFLQGWNPQREVLDPYAGTLSCATNLESIADEAARLAVENRLGLTVVEQTELFRVRLCGRDRFGNALTCPVADVAWNSKGRLEALPAGKTGLALDVLLVQVAPPTAQQWQDLLKASYDLGVPMHGWEGIQTDLNAKRGCTNSKYSTKETCLTAGKTWDELIDLSEDAALVPIATTKLAIDETTEITLGHRLDLMTDHHNAETHGRCLVNAIWDKQINAESECRQKSGEWRDTLVTDHSVLAFDVHIALQCDVTAVPETKLVKTVIDSRQTANCPTWDAAGCGELPVDKSRTDIAGKLYQLPPGEIVGNPVTFRLVGEVPSYAPNTLTSVVLADELPPELSRIGLLDRKALRVVMPNGLDTGLQLVAGRDYVWDGSNEKRVRVAFTASGLAQLNDFMLQSPAAPVARVSLVLTFQARAITQGDPFINGGRGTSLKIKYSDDTELPVYANQVAIAYGGVSIWKYATELAAQLGLTETDIQHQISLDANGKISIPGAEFMLFRTIPAAQAWDVALGKSSSSSPEFQPLAFHSLAECTRTPALVNPALRACLDEEANYLAAVTVVQADKYGHAMFGGLAYGDYWAIETKAPAGYAALTEPILITISEPLDGMFFDDGNAVPGEPEDDVLVANTLIEAPTSPPVSPPASQYPPTAPASTPTASLPSEPGTTAWPSATPGQISPEQSEQPTLWPGVVPPGPEATAPSATPTVSPSRATPTPSKRPTASAGESPEPSATPLHTTSVKEPEPTSPNDGEKRPTPTEPGQAAKKPTGKLFTTGASLTGLIAGLAVVFVALLARRRRAEEVIVVDPNQVDPGQKTRQRRAR